MTDAIPLVIRYVLVVAVSIALGIFLRRRAPKARWIFTGLLLVSLAVVNTRYSLWLRVAGLCIGIGLVVWDYRRNRTSANKTTG